jgi:hypothetical protein
MRRLLDHLGPFRLWPAVAAMVAGAVLAGCGSASLPSQASTSDAAKGAVISQTLRQKALAVSRETLAIPTPTATAPVWGVIMDWSMPPGFVTLVALGDGATSIYFSTGGGFIGAGEHQEVRKANATFLAAASRCVSQMSPTTTFPLPADGRIIFYLKSDNGVLTAAATEAELTGGNHPLSQLFAAAQDVITQVRLVTQDGATGG